MVVTLYTTSRTCGISSFFECIFFFLKLSSIYKKKSPGGLNPIPAHATDFGQPPDTVLILTRLVPTVLFVSKDAGARVGALDPVTFTKVVTRPATLTASTFAFVRSLCNLCR